MSGETDLDRLLAGLDPVQRPGEYVYCPVGDGFDLSLAAAVVREPEAVTVVLDREVADRLRLPYDYVAGWITLRVHSALAAVGLTAAFSRALADIGISANVLAGYYHDHLLVPIERVDDALAALTAMVR
jgi:hypothetical protein